MRLRKKGSRGGAAIAEAITAPEPSAEQATVPADAAIAPDGTRLGELAVRMNLATTDQVAAALAVAARGASERIGAILIGQGALTPRNLARLVASQQGLETIDLGESTPDKEAIDLLPEARARALRAVPVRLDGDLLVVATSAPSASLTATLQQATGRAPVLVVAPEGDIARAIDTAYRALSDIGAHVRLFEEHDALRAGTVRADGPRLEDDAPVVRVVALILTQALRDRASDVHIEPQSDRIRVRYRVDGALHDILELPAAMGPVIVSRIKIMGGMNIVERRRPQDGQISMQIEGRDVDIRVSTTSVVGGEKVVLRLLDKSRPMYELGQLGMRAEIRQRYAALLRAPYGMVICAGPTGSGKTTTLYGSLQELNSPERNIMTIEDPVEYTFPMINQIQINEAAGITFADGLRSILRQDPDVILVGEIRDVDTARIAVQAALTGHFVLSSLHAQDASSALHRLLDMGIEHFLVASAVTAVVAQRLMRRVCPHCRVSYDPTAEELALLETLAADAPPDGFVHGAGCNFCGQTGYLDRVGVYEMLPITETVREAVLHQATLSQIRVIAAQEGMDTLREEAVRLVQAGVTDLAEVLRSIYLPGS